MKRIHPVLTLLIVAVLAYGLLIPQLGFYWDDLPMSWIRYQLGAEAMTRYFSTNRPVWALLYQVTTSILPQVPIYWQVFALFWRWMGAVTLWALASRLLPLRPKFALVLSVAFMLYPGFNQQWGSYLYSHFFIVLFFFLFSLYLMLLGRTIPALIFSALNLWMMEYFFILELARPLMLWIYRAKAAGSVRTRVMDILREWTPYLVVFVLAVLSRLFIFNNQVYGFSLRESFSDTPVETTTSVLENVISSLWTVTLSAWGLIFKGPNPNLDGIRTLLIYAVVVLTTAALVFVNLRKMSNGSNEPRKEISQILLLGVVLLVLGGPPFWLTNVPVTLGFPANRATLAFMLGASFLFAGILEYLPRKFTIALSAALLALAAGRQFLWANEFRRDWTSHRNLFWQMTWRAPALEKNTLVLMNEELSFYADNSLGAALNWIYSPEGHDDQIDYALFYPTNRLGASLPELEPGSPVHYDFLAGEFKGSTSQAVVFYYDPPGCLRLLDPKIDPVNRLIPQDTYLREAARLSAISQITPEKVARMPAVYGPEPVHGWCYHFQKADLARQRRDWEEVAGLGNIAFDLDDYPNDPVERFVFIEGYAHIGDWEKAVELSLSSYKVSKNYTGPLLCALWDRIEKETPHSPEQNFALVQMRDGLGCAP